MKFVAETAKILRRKGRLQQFVFLADRSIELLQGNLKQKKDLFFEITIGYNFYIERHECEHVLKYYLAVEKMFDNSVGEQKFRMDILFKIGEAYSFTANYRKILKYTLKAEKIAIEVKDKQGEAACCTNLGTAYYLSAEYEKAIMYYQKSLKISSAIGDRSGIATINRNLGNAYLVLGEYEKSIMYYKKGLEISSTIGDQSGIARNNGNLGDAYRMLGECEKAIVYYQKGLEISNAIGDRSQIARISGKLGSTYCILGEYENSIMYNQKGLEISRAIGDRLGIATINVNLGNICLIFGKCQEAIDFLKDGLKISVEIGQPNVESWCLASIGTTYFLEAQCKFDKCDFFSICQQAVSYFIASIHCRDQIFSTVFVDQHKISFAKEYFILHVTLMRCFIFLERLEAALLVIDLGKAKALHAFREKVKKSETDDSIDLTWKMIDENKEKMRTKEIQEALELKSNSTALLYAFDHENRLNIWVANGEDGVKTFKYNELVKEFDMFFDFMRSNCDVNLNRDSSFQKLDSAGFTPDYQMIVPEQLFKTSVKEKSVDATKQAKIPDLDQSENTSFTPFRKIPIDKSENIFQRTIFRLLYQALIHSIKEFIRGTKIIIVPDKFLFFIPFCSLLCENGCQLSENYSIQIAPSLHTLVSSMTRSRDTGLGFALFVGNPTVGKVTFRLELIEISSLHGANEEVKYLAPLFGAQPLVEGKATKKRVLKFLSGASIIHIAAHGEPDRGEIFLAPNPNMLEPSSSLLEENSYLLKQRDIMKITINARFVVLCCCHTGKGKISSEGVVGLARAFLCAGARSVLATLWRLNDGATKEFMKIFYDEICDGTSVCEALRRAMNTFQEHRNVDFRSFKIWAPFTIYGEDVRFTRDDIEEIKRKSREMNF